MKSDFRIPKTEITIIIVMIICCFSANAYWKEQPNATTYMFVNGSCTWSNQDNFIDNNWTTAASFSQAIDSCGFFANYTSIINTGSNLIWMVKDQAATSNLSIGNGCYNATNTQLYYWGARGVSACSYRWWCWNYTSKAYVLLRSGDPGGTGSCFPYEESLYYNYTLPANLTLDLSGNVANCSESHGVAVVLKLNNSPVGNPYDPGSVLGYYSFNCSAAGDENYTANYTTGSFTIYPVVYNVTVFLNGTDQNLSGTWLYPINFTCESDGILPLFLYLNGSVISNGTVHELSASYWNFTCSDLTTQKSLFLTVNKASGISRLYLNGSQNNMVTTWPGASNATASVDYGVVVLERNGSIVSSPDVNVFSPGLYVYDAYSSGDENHSASTVTWNLLVNKAYSNVMVYINGVHADRTELVGFVSNVTVTSTYGTPILSQDGAVKASPYVNTLPLGFYVFWGNVSEGENWSQSSTFYTLNIKLSDNANDEFIGAFAALGIGLIIAAHYFKTKFKK